MTSRKRDFLVEIGTEELPPKALRLLQQAFADNLAAGLAKAGLEHGEMQPFATPRRLAVLVRRLAAHQPDQKIERRGPPVSAAFDAEGLPTRAAQAFAASCKASIEELQRRDEGKGTFLHYVGIKAGAPAAELLPGLVGSALDALPIPRRMRWGAGEAQFVRPVHWIAMLYGKEVVPASLLDTASGNLTRGHRFHAPKPLRLSSPNVYERMLRERGYVVADFDARRSLIRERVAAVAADLGGRPLMSDALLDEVTALVEWPVPLAGRFEERFLSLPREVLISTLEDHQRYFPVEDADGTLLPALHHGGQHREPRSREGASRATSVSYGRGSPTRRSSGSRTASHRLPRAPTGWLKSLSRRSLAPSATRPGVSRPWQRILRRRAPSPVPPTLARSRARAARRSSANAIS